MGKIDSEESKGKTKQVEAYVDWKMQLQDILDKNLSKRANGNVASFATQSDRANVIFGFFNNLRQSGFKVEPRNIKKKHVKCVVQIWEKQRLSGGTIQKYLSVMRQYAEWINKPGLIGEAEEFLENPKSIARNYIATTDKSWDDKAEIDKYRLITEIFIKDQYVGIQLLMQDAFGLRRKEAVSFRPYLNEKNGMIFVTDGTKGGKQRWLPIDNDYKRAVIKKAQQFVNYTQAHLGNPQLNLVQNLERYEYIIGKVFKMNKKTIGVSGHGLRAGFAMRELEVRGLLPVLKGGKIGELDKAEEKRIRIEVAELLGHHRTRVTTAYSGAETKHGLNRLTKYEAAELEKIIPTLEVGKIYRFSTHEYLSETNELIESTVLERKYLSMIRRGDLFYFEVERAVPYLEHVLAMEHVKMITVVR